MLPGKLADANVQQLTTSLGIAVDKMLLLEGKPTQISQPVNQAVASMTAEERAAEIAAILERGRERLRLRMLENQQPGGIEVDG